MLLAEGQVETVAGPETQMEEASEPWQWELQSSSVLISGVFKIINTTDFLKYIIGTEDQT